MNFVLLIDHVSVDNKINAQSQGKKLCAKGNNYAAPDGDTSDSDFLVLKAIKLDPIYYFPLFQKQNTTKQEAFGERRHLHVCDL